MRHFRLRRGRVVLIVAAGIAIAAISASGAAGAKHDDGSAKKLGQDQAHRRHLRGEPQLRQPVRRLGGRQRPRQRRRRPHEPDQPGRRCRTACLLQNDVNLTSPPLPADCTDTTTGTAFTSHFTNSAVHASRTYIPATRADVPAAGRVRAERAHAEPRQPAGRLHRGHRAPLLPGAVPAQQRRAEPLRHRQRRRRA